MAKQAVKKGAGVKSFSVQDFKKNLLGEEQAKSADKELEWILMPKAFQDALKLPGIPTSRVTMLRGWEDVGKSSVKNAIIASGMANNYLVVIFETEGNFDFQYAKDCGMDITPVYSKVEEVDEKTGLVTEKEVITDWIGNYFLFTPRKICEYCGDNDYSTGTKRKNKRKTAVIEDIAYIINDFMNMQEEGKIPMSLLFVWDSIGSIGSWKSYQSKVGNPMFDAAALSACFKPIFSRIGSSKERGNEESDKYTTTLVVVNKIWKDGVNSMGNAVSIENAGGKAFAYGIRLGIHIGGIAKPGVKKLKATSHNLEYQYGTLSKIAVFKNHLPTPFNLTYSNSICFVHNGMISEDELDNYKKKELPAILKKLKELNPTLGDVSEDEVTFVEEGTLED